MLKKLLFVAPTLVLLFFASCGKDNSAVVVGDDNAEGDEPLTRHLQKIERRDSRHPDRLSVSLITWDGDKIIRIEDDPSNIEQSSQCVVDFLYDGDRIVGSNHIIRSTSRNDTLYKVTYHYNGNVIDYIDMRSMYGVNDDRHIDYVYDNGKIVRLTVSGVSHNSVEDFDWNNGNVFVVDGSYLDVAVEYGNIINPFRFPMGVGYYELGVWEISNSLPLMGLDVTCPFVWCKNMPIQLMGDDIVFDFEWTSEDGYPTSVTFPYFDKKEEGEGDLIIINYYYE